MNTIFSKSYKKDMMLSFLICLLPRIVMASQMIPLVEPRDEVSTMVGAAYVAGMDWSNVISTGGAYYGLGYTILFSPILMFTKSPIVLYRSILIVSSILFSLIAPISYHLLRTYFSIIDKKYLMVSSIACSYMIAGTVGPVAMNEAMLILVVWLIAWCILKVLNADDYKVIIGGTCVGVMLITYAQFIHTRALVLYVAVVFMLIWKGFVDKKRGTVKYIIITLVLLLIGYNLINCINGYYQNAIWNASSNSNLANAYIEADSSTFELLLSQDSWNAWFSIILGQLNTIAIYTGGFAVVCMVFFMHICSQFVLKRKERNSQFFNNYKNIMVVSVFCLICVVITIGGQSLIWLAGVVNAFKDGYGTANYGIRALTYIRYFGCYVGPVLLCGLVLLYRLRSKAKVFFNISIAVVVILHTYWIFCIIPYLYNNNTSIDIFTALSFGNWDSSANLYVYLSGSIFLLVLMCIFGWLIYKNKITLCVLVLAVFLGYQHIYLYGTYVLKTRNIAKTVDSGIELIRNIQDEGFREFPIYVVGNQIPFTYQFYLATEELIWDIPNEDENEAIVLMNTLAEAPKLLDLEYMFGKLDENEYVAIRGERLTNVVSSLGYELFDFIPYEQQLYFEDENVDSKGDDEKKIVMSSQAITLEAGTYKIEFAQNDTRNFDEVYAGLNDGTTIFSRLSMREETTQEDLFFSIPQKTAGIKVYFVTSEDASEIVLKDVICKKVDSSFWVGYNNYSDLMLIENYMNTYSDISQIIYLGYKNIDNVSVLETFFSDYNVMIKNAYEINNENAYILVLNGNKDWYTLLDRYDICIRYQDYLLLAPKESQAIHAIPENKRISYGNELMPKFFENIEGEFYSDKISLHPGIYVINLELQVDDIEWPLYINIKDGEQIIHTDILNDDTDPSIRLSTEENVSELICEVVDTHNEFVNVNLKSIMIESAGIKYWYDKNLREIVRVWSDFSEKTDGLIIGLESTGQITEVNSYIEGNSILGIEVCELETIETLLNVESDLVVPKNSKLLYKLLDGGYSILEITDEYALLTDNVFDATLYYKDGIILPEFYAVDGEFLINLPSGVFELVFETNSESKSVEMDQESEVGFIKVEKGGRSIANRKIYKGESRITLPISSKDGLTDLKFSIFKSDSENLQVSWLGIRYISDGYMIDLKSMSTKSAVVTEDGIISTQQDNATIFGPYMTLDKGKYEIDFYYKTSNLEHVSFDVSANAGADIICDSETGNTLQEGDLYKTKLNFALEEKTNSIEFRSYSSMNDRFELKYIIIVPIQEE